MLGAGIEDPRIVRKEVPAGRPAEAARDAPQPRAVGVHDVFLIAAGRVFGRLALQDQLPAGRGPIRLGVLPAEGELPDVAQMGFPGIGGDDHRLEDEEDQVHRAMKANADCGLRIAESPTWLSIRNPQSPIRN